MTQLPVLIDLDPARAGTSSCCGIKNPAHEGRRRKICWMQANLKNGLRAKALVAPGGRQCGYLEYLPGEYAWRAVKAPGYMFLHCIWTFHSDCQGKGYGSRMVQACVEDAQKSGMKGVAVLAREQPWLAGAALYLANGFTAVDAAPPDFRLLVRKLDPSAANPTFAGGWEKKLKRYGRGLTIMRSDQCPYIVKFAGEIAQTAEREYGIEPRVVELKSHREAQAAPTPYAVFAVIHDGRVLADHQISRTRFRNIMRTLPGARG